MIKGCLRIVRDNVVKLTFPGPMVTIKNDGTLWVSGVPILGMTDSTDRENAISAVKEKRWNDIPHNFYTILGENHNGLWAGDDDAWNTHPAKTEADRLADLKKAEDAKKVEIHLSSRGWGDFSPVQWYGDITRLNSEILSECKKALAAEHDVDHANQSDEELLEKIIAARAAWSKPKVLYKEPEHGPGYCYSCESYCFGDCGNYKPDLTTEVINKKLKDTLNSAVKEENYGIHD